ncbi:uncharacterized protein N7482_000559 [Penicillium canariense]|uniref:Bacteriophage T5 Orf172 DNA-binding domain-containing protein n=1 Tax=Penicillium canariense TaxID=189055 RepID=A0A9W9IDZ7_9EURO|nr:uncharacterized protein N7482_000559 [Penicillium canariense]KAJ5174682.1 hypothetical protein N7482_000559 [Penicillium canariense]
MESLVTTFFSLAELVDWDHGAPASIECAYRKDDQSRCKGRIARDNLILAGLQFASHFEIFTGASGGCAPESPQFKILQNLASIYICHFHKKHESQAIEQWRKELDVRGNSTGIKPDEEENPFEEEGVSVLSNQSLPIKTLRRAMTMEDEAVAKNVTWLLKQPLDGPRSQKSGYIYVISPPGLSGMFKIGYTLEHPKLGRLDKHNDCYGVTKPIATEYTQYAYRVEQLLLAEFSNNHHQLEVRCQKCDYSHRELLRIDQKTLIRSLKKWVAFIKLPAYDTSGLLLTEAQSGLPRPALKQFLGCERPKRGSPGGPNSTKKGESQEFYTAPLRPLDFEAPTSTKKYSEVKEVVKPDEICSDVENLHLTPSKSANRRKRR